MLFKKALSALVLVVPFVLGLPGKRASTLNPKCNFLQPIAKDLIDNLFEKECGDAAHGALRLIFHDAIGISPTAGGGGADGSILIFNTTELNLTIFPANEGLDDVVNDQIGPFFLKYADVISPGDFVQLAGALSISQCPGAPRVKFSIGRPPPKAASPPNLVPEPFDSVDKILARFGEVGFSPEEVIALLSSHSVAGADDIDPKAAGIPFDSTPSVYDTNIFIDVLLKGTLLASNRTAPSQGESLTAINGTLRLQSDDLLARDPRTACTWQSFANNHDLVAAKFALAVFKLSLLGQSHNPNLIDCSEIIPEPPSFNDVPMFPPGQTIRDIQQSCAIAPFPNLHTQPGAPLTPLAGDVAEGQSTHKHTHVHKLIAASAA